jgi:hypothetical protein
MNVALVAQEPERGCLSSTAVIFRESIDYVNCTKGLHCDSFITLSYLSQSEEKS